MRETCFKHNGYPNWFKDYKLKKGKEKANMGAHVNDTPLNCENNNVQSKADWNMRLLVQEIMKCMKNHE